jgi:hypothetical protein
LIVVACDEDDLVGGHPVEPVLERPFEECMLRAQVVLAGERDVAGNEEQVTRRHVYEVLVKVR